MRRHRGYSKDRLKELQQNKTDSERLIELEDSMSSLEVSVEESYESMEKFVKFMGFCLLTTLLVVLTFLVTKYFLS